MNWSIEFDPFVSWPVLWALAALGVLLFGLLLWRSRRGALLRAASYALLLLAIANPQLKEEDREPLNDVLAVVVDDSQSQAIAGRVDRTETVRRALEDRLKAIANLDIRWVRSTSTSGDSDRDGTMLFTDLGKALADVPPDRLAGVVMLTDGNVHDVPGSAAALGFDAPVHALITGKPGEFDRRLEILKAPRFGLVGGTQPVEVKVTETKPGDIGVVKLTVTRQGEGPTTKTVRVGETVEIPVDVQHAGPNIVEIEAEGRAGRADHGEQPRGAHHRGRAREFARAAGLRRASCRRADLAQHAQIRCRGRSRAFHHSAAAGEAGRHADQSALADRLPDARAVPGEARSVRPHHLRPLSAAWRAAVALSGECRPLRRTRRRRAGLRRRRLRLASEPVPHAAWPGASRRAPSGRVIEQPFKPKLTDLGERHPVTSDLPGSEGEEPSWGHWFRIVDADPRDAEVLMKGANGKPLLVSAQRGEGRVALLLSDHIWLWARGYEGGGPYTDLLRRLAHWLMKEPDLEEETLKATSRGQTLMLDRRSIKDSVEPVIVTAPSGKKETVTLDEGEPGSWGKSITAQEQGVYRVASGKLASIVTVGNANAKELSAVTATDSALAPLLKETGGGSFWLGRTKEDAATLPRIVMLRAAASCMAAIGSDCTSGRPITSRRPAVPAVHRFSGARRPARDDRHHLVPRRPLAGFRADRTCGAAKRFRNELKREQARRIDRPRQRDLSVRDGRETEAFVIGHVADEQHQAEVLPPSTSDALRHQRLAVALPLKAGSTTSGPRRSARLSAPIATAVKRMPATSRPPSHPVRLKAVTGATPSRTR